MSKSRVHWHKKKSFLVVRTGNGWLGSVYGYDCQVAANSYDDCVSACQANIDQIEKCDQGENCFSHLFNKGKQRYCSVCKRWQSESELCQLFVDEFTPLAPPSQVKAAPLG